MLYMMKHLRLQGRPAAQPGPLGWFLTSAGLFALLALEQAPPAAATRSADFSLFDTTVAVLPNGNMVIVDSGYDQDSTLDVGAVYLYDGRTNALVSMLTGTTAED